MTRHMPTTDDLFELLDIELLDKDLYRGINETAAVKYPALFGGQVAAQALRAAAYSVPEGRQPNSLHGYFLRPGRVDQAVILKVDRERDGGSFSARHVVAVQGGEVIFSMSASFQVPRQGPQWCPPAEPEFQPDQLDEGGVIDRFDHTVDIRGFPPAVPYDPQDWPVPGRMWVRARKQLPDDATLHACALTYMSDIGSGFGDGQAPGLPRGGPSIDHAVWFHEPLRTDDWIYIGMWPLKAGGGRGLYSGIMQDLDGHVGATFTQEILFRRPERPVPTTAHLSS
ncbi:MAG: acyl-CoA thioesterase [Acidimicrobiales bacterium]